jgi:thymidylate kinase
VVLRERDTPGGANIGLIDTVARYALDHGFHVILDGILDSRRYGATLEALRRDHRGISYWYYLDVPFEETMRRHATRRQAAEFGRDEMQRWYREFDLLPGGIEQIIPASNSLDDTVQQVIRDAGLASQQQPALQS